MNKTFKKPLHLIIDGADKLGKTTVIQLLSKRLSLPVYKMLNMPDYIKEGVEEDASKVFNETIAQIQGDYILDRGYPSSFIYSAYFSRNSDLSYLGEIIHTMKPQVFILHGTPRCKDDIVTESAQVALNDLYYKYAMINKWNIIEVDGLTPLKICNKILKLL